MGGGTSNGLGLPGSCGCFASPAGMLQDGVVLQSEHLLDDLVLAVPQLEYLLVGWALEVGQRVSCGAD